MLGNPWMNKHKILLDMAENQIIFVPGRCDYDRAPIATLFLKPQTLKSQSDDKIHTAAFYTFFIKQINVAALAAAILPLTPALAAPPSFKVKNKNKPKLNTGKTKLTSILKDKQPKVLDIAEINVLVFHLLARRWKKHKILCFSPTMINIKKSIRNEAIVGDARPHQISEMSVAVEESIKQKLSAEYYDLIDAFN